MRTTQLDRRLNDQGNAKGTTNTNRASGSHVASARLAIAHITLNPVELSFKWGRYFHTSRNETLPT